MRDWRIVGRGEAGEVFLLVVGDSREDVIGRLPAVLAAYTDAELRCLDSGSIERFEAERLDGMGVPVGQWRPVDGITLGPHWLRNHKHDRTMG